MAYLLLAVARRIPSDLVLHLLHRAYRALHTHIGELNIQVVC
jgi:hypothetical protein